MIRLSYTLKCWALGIMYSLGFHFLVLSSNPDFAKYSYILAISTLLLAVAKRAVDVVSDFIAPHTIIFNGLLSSLLINIVIWLLTPFIVALTRSAFLFYGMGVITKKIRAKP